MAKLTFCVFIFGFFVFHKIAASTNLVDEKNSIFDCLYETNSLACVKNHADAQLNTIETEVSGRQSAIAFSQVLEEASSLVVDGSRSLFGFIDESDGIEDNEEIKDEGRNDLSQARKKFGKKKKKMLQKLIAFGMILKSKISLLLQLISTHLQVKFFILAIISLVINIARFWIDLKKDGHPAKVVYYEHAQHQHHYDHDDHIDHGGYWGRSDEDFPSQEMAYSAYKEK